MDQFILATDSGCDLPAALCAERNIHVFQMKYAIDGVSYVDHSNPAEAPAFYNRMRAGAVPMTSMISSYEFFEFWTRLWENHHLPIVHISLGSAVSGTYSNGVLGRDKVREVYPDAEIHFIDSMLASLGYGLLCLEAAELRDEGKSPQEAVEWVKQRKPNINGYFTTDDLIYLHRSGRLSRASAFVASALNINPILRFDDAGRLLVSEKVRGRKNGLNRIHELEREMAVEPVSQLVYIVHSDCKPEEVQAFRDTLIQQNGFKGSYTNFIGPIIGSHAGPGLIAAFFSGPPRTE